MLARVLSQKINESWGQPVIVDNPGAGAIGDLRHLSKVDPAGRISLRTTRPCIGSRPKSVPV